MDHWTIHLSSSLLVPCGTYHIVFRPKQQMVVYWQHMCQYHVWDLPIMSTISMSVIYMYVILVGGID